MALFTRAKSRSITRQADNERDAKNWSEAAALYAQALEIVGWNKRSIGFVIQLGNCLKEAGRLQDAMTAYDSALKINANNADLHLQRGHLLKIMGKMSDCVAEYQVAFNLDSTNPHAREELERAGSLAVVRNSFPNTQEQLRTIWLDVTDFMEYARVNVSLSGIQRVLANLALYLKHADMPGYRVVPIVPEYDRFRILGVNTAAFIDLVEVYNQLHVDRHLLDQKIQAVFDSRFSINPEPDDMIVVAGAFWIYPHYDAIMHLRQRGVRFGLFVHDLIQVRMPEYVERAATDKFYIQMSDAFDIADFIMANSEYVANDIKDFIREHKNYTLPVQAVVLPTELRSNPENPTIANQSILDVVSRDYVIVVSTIEIRKNHSLVIKAWEKLREEFGEDTPDLVFVGKWGWEIDILRHYIEEKGYVGDWLFIFNGISDTEMEFLYRHSIMSIYPSFAEGFGLPIGESLVYGIPCIASNTTSMPEVGGSFVRYIDPFSLEQSYPVIRDSILDRPGLQEWKERIIRDFEPKTWHQFSREFYEVTRQEAERLRGSGVHANCRVPEGEFILGGSHDILRLGREGGKMLTFRSARHRWWHPANHWGAWSQNRRCEIQFISDLHEGEHIEIFLRLHRHSGRESDPIAIIQAGAGENAFHLSEHPTIYRFTGRVTGGGVVHISLLARGKYPSNTEFIGWSGIAYCRSDNAEALIKTYNSIMIPGRHPSLVTFNTTSPVKLPN